MKNARSKLKKNSWTLPVLAFALLFPLFAWHSRLWAQPEPEGPQTGELENKNHPGENKKTEGPAQEADQKEKSKKIRVIFDQTPLKALPFSRQAGILTHEILSILLGRVTLEAGIHFTSTEFYSKYSGPLDFHRIKSTYEDDTQYDTFRLGSSSGYRPIYQIASEPHSLLNIGTATGLRWAKPMSIRFSYSILSPRTVKTWLNGYPSNGGYLNRDINQMFAADNLIREGIVLRATEAVYRDTRIYATLYPLFYEWDYVSLAAGLSYGQSYYSFELFDYTFLEQQLPLPVAVRISESGNRFRPLTYSLIELSVRMHHIFPDSELWENTSIHISTRTTIPSSGRSLKISPWVFRSYDLRKDYNESSLLLVPPERIYINDYDFSITFRKRFRLY